ncbi:MAG: hypothetical protein EBY40_05555 [Marivivens sp.]|nr:hypothetical protein [Marivivens sp.]NBT50617.1 hypothetical protein [Marivivens sp.]NCW68395.1 hypothetical protein [Marivivens sp.]NDH02581.1 hypothetical protein [Marivivens sp.]
MIKLIRKPFKVYLTEQEREILDGQAKQLGMPRGEMIRQRALSAPQQAAGLPQGPQVYADALEAAARSYSGIPRTAMAGIVSAVIRSLAEH